MLGDAGSVPLQLDMTALGPFLLLSEGLTDCAGSPAVVRLLYISASEIRDRPCPTPGGDRWTEPSARLAALKTLWAKVLHQPYSHISP